MRTLLITWCLMACSPAENSTDDSDSSPDDDSDGDTDSDTSPPEPTAVAGEDQSIPTLVPVQLDGSGSFDGDRPPVLDYYWSVASAPEGSVAAVSDPTDTRPTFAPDLAGTYTITLTVANVAGTWDSTPDTLTISAKDARGFAVRLTWDTATDLDLHLLQGDAEMWDVPGDACYCNSDPDWGVVGRRSDNPIFEPDPDGGGFGPEQFSIVEPAAGDYRVVVHAYGDPTSEPRNTVTLEVFLDGVLYQSHAGSLERPDEVWEVGTMTWPGGFMFTDRYSLDNSFGRCGDSGGW